MHHLTAVRGASGFCQHFFAERRRATQKIHAVAPPVPPPLPMRHQGTTFPRFLQPGMRALGQVNKQAECGVSFVPTPACCSSVAGEFSSECCCKTGTREQHRTPNSTVLPGRFYRDGVFGPGNPISVQEACRLGLLRALAAFKPFAKPRNLFPLPGDLLSTPNASLDKRSR